MIPSFVRSIRTSSLARHSSSSYSSVSEDRRPTYAANPRVERQKDAHSPDFYPTTPSSFTKILGLDFVRIPTLWSGTVRRLVLRLHNTEASFLGIDNLIVQKIPSRVL